MNVNKKIRSGQGYDGIFKEEIITDYRYSGTNMGTLTSAYLNWEI